MCMCVVAKMIISQPSDMLNVLGDPYQALVLDLLHTKKKPACRILAITHALMILSDFT